MKRERLTVDLPVCPTCHHIGKLPVGISAIKNYCRGPVGAAHPKARMVPTLFVEAVVEAECEDHDDSRVAA